MKSLALLKALNQQPHLYRAGDAPWSFLCLKQVHVETLRQLHFLDYEAHSGLYRLAPQIMRLSNGVMPRSQMARIIAHHAAPVHAAAGALHAVLI